MRRKSIRYQFADMTRLYHFTSFDSAGKIIESNQLRCGKLFDMNDLIENNKMVYQHIILGNLDKDDSNGEYAEEEINRYQQISFAQDRVVDDKVYEGFNLHVMWGLYANKGFGVCLVFDKDKLKLTDRDYANSVSYHDFIPSGYVFHNTSKSGLKTEIFDRRDEIFFCKRKEWEHEQEFRIIRRAKNKYEDNYLDVSDALSFVILCYEGLVFDDEFPCDGNHSEVLRKIDKKLPVLKYEVDIDGYTLWDNSCVDDPIWTEEDGFYI